MISKRAFNLFSKSATISNQPYDILIVGGGPAGLALASSLGSNDSLKYLKIGLIEANSLDNVRTYNSNGLSAYSNRCSSISASNFNNLKMNLLKKYTGIGVLDGLDLSRVSPVNNMQVWDGRTDARITFGRQIDDEDLPLIKDNTTLSYMMENTNLQHAFLKHIEGSTSIELLESSKISSIERDNEWPRVQLENGTSLRTRLLIGADGFNSPVRKFASIDSFGWAYNAAGFVSTLKTHPSNTISHSSRTAFQRFLPSGPIAYLPLPDRSASMVWSTTPEMAKKFKQIDSRVLVLLINAAFRFSDDVLKILYSKIDLEYDSFFSLIKEVEIAEGIDMTTSRQISELSNQDGIPPSDHELYPPLVTSIEEGSQASFPLKMNHVDGYDASRVALVGDAAHSCHPLAGQGLNLGLADVQSLTSVLSEGRRYGGDIGSKTVLERYTRDRYIQNMMMLSATDKLNALFKVNDGNPLVELRSIGLETLNEIDSLKDLLMKQAGTTGNFEDSGRGSRGVNFIADGIEGVGKAVNMFSAVARQLGNIGEAKIAEIVDNKR
ncbi:ubiquinone biosynthesis hydrox [Wallemia mellicola]|uniref:Ubiquinone biosynthesis monooxygenase COQ6, mitochondrial n=1 Tax=Wallemia mellicola TaxID=1708541 RepID=A0AB38MRL3_9BASI|nr:ubiquinone biosynthesis hydrox [Wallemia mellicola]TIC11647.1 ubiquinone biosynthesis hydrox [Wallemia mellicola]TIC35932.1 ubiquinone biosynthesis hydrox [Wallemia mellicola]TIC61150.1 ubiquinone biosynthesis hydrox [Wallemia mellicola]